MDSDVKKWSMGDFQKVIYTGICMCRTQQITWRWQISQLLVVINLALLSFLGTQKVSEDLYLYFGFGGIALNVLWLLLTVTVKAGLITGIPFLQKWNHQK